MLVGYGRVSRIDQNPALQDDALRAAGCERLFVEKVGGGKKDRPQLAAALDYLRAGDTLIVWKLDRLARSLKELIETVEDLGKRGVMFRSLTENIDTTTPGGMLIFHIFGATAQFERSLIRERTRAGLASAKARGRLGGRPPALTGERLEAAGALVQAGKPIASVARSFGVSRPTLYRSLERAGIDVSAV